MNKSSSDNQSLLISVIVFAACSAFAIGFDTVFIISAHDPLCASDHLSPFQWSLVASSSILGSLLTLFITGKLTDRYGAKRLLAFATSLFITSFIGLIVTQKLFLLIIFRLLSGIATGIFAFGLPKYLGENAPVAFRGKIILINALSMSLGQIFTYIFCYYQLHSHWMNWHSGIETQIILFVIALYALNNCPKELSITHKKQIVNHFFVPAEYHRVIALGCLLGFFQQGMGITPLLFYGPLIFKQLGSQINTSMSMMGIITVFNFICTVLSFFLIDRLGRRPLLIAGLTIATLSLITFASLIAGKSTALSFYLIVIIAYICGYCISLGSLFWVLIAEIFPSAIRGTAMSYATFAQTVTNFIITLSFLTAVKDFGLAPVFYIFAFIAGCALLACYCLIPETKNISLLEIEKKMMRSMQSKA